MPGPYVQIASGPEIPAVTPDVTRLDWWNCEYGQNDPHTVGFLPHLINLPQIVIPWFASGQSGLYWDRLGDFWIIIVSTVFCAALRVLTKYYVFPSIARVFAGIPSSNRKKTHKFCYQVWLLTYYAFTSAMGIALLSQLPWFGAPLKCVANTELWKDHPNSKFPRVFEIFYIGQAGFYVSEFVATVLETHRSDFWVYIWHHVCTLVLIMGSYLSLDIRIGSLVFLFHDIPDIVLSLTKVFHYARYDLMCNISFVGLAISYFVFRLYLFPGIIYTAWILPMAVRPDQMWNFVNLILITFGLVPLHFFWFYLILRMIWRAVFDKGIAQDIRSDTEDEADTAMPTHKPEPKITQRKGAGRGDRATESPNNSNPPSPTAGGRVGRTVRRED